VSRVDSVAAVWRNARSPPLVPLRGRLTGRALSMGHNAVTLIVAKVVTMGLGFAFWLVAARLFSAHEVGLATAAVSAIMLVTQLALLGVGSAVIALYPAERERPARLLDSALTIVGGAALLGGLVFLALSATFLDNLRVVATQPLFAVGFVVMSVMGAAGIVLDQTATVLRRGDHVLVRAVLNGVVSLVALVALLLMPGGADAAWIFATWVIGGAAMCSWGTLQLHRELAGYRPRVRLAGKAGELLRVGVPNHLLTLADRAPGLILPILVTELLSPTANAHWYAVWMMAWVLYIIPIQVGMTLFAEASHRSRPLGMLVRQGVRHALVLGLPAAVALALLAPQALELLGGGYAAAGARPLRILVLALVPMTFVQVYYVVCRAGRRLREATITAVVSGVLAVGGGALVAPHSGLEGVAVAWVLAQAATGAWAIARLLALPREAAADVAKFEETEAH
jgi:O-antigen/teichoic acid export membrane protein